MDGDRFDALVRSLTGSRPRRAIFAALGAAGLAATGLGLPVTAAHKHRRCRPGEKRCGKKCVRGTCCPDQRCGGGPCHCRKTVEGSTACIADQLVVCEQCESSEACGTGELCVRVRCEDVTAICVPACDA